MYYVNNACTELIIHLHWSSLQPQLCYIVLPLKPLKTNWWWCRALKPWRGRKSTDCQGLHKSAIPGDCRHNISIAEDKCVWIQRGREMYIYIHIQRHTNWRTYLIITYFVVFHNEHFGTELKICFSWNRGGMNLLWKSVRMFLLWKPTTNN